jgi:acetoin utilization deacetylase AcuC-like enzyme
LARYCIVYDETFKLHEPPYGTHPENPSRLERALRGVSETKLLSLWRLVQPSPRRGTERAYILDVHDEAYVKEVEKLSEMGGGYIDADTYVGYYTVEAAKAYISALLDAVDKLVEGECNAIMVLGRPPGHHAGKAGAAMGAPTLGFCIFNVSAIAAKYAKFRTKGYILMIDFDLHHGNGTQEILYEDKDVVHLDLHQDPSTIYPGTGWPWEYGSGEAKGTKINVLLPPDTGDDVYMHVFNLAFDMVLELYGMPSMIIVDAGFDGYLGDGLGLLRLTSNTYHHIGTVLSKLNVPVLTVFEGGYSLGLERGLPAYLAGLAGLANPSKEEPTESRRAVWKEALENFERLRNTILGVVEGE